MPFCPRSYRLDIPLWENTWLVCIEILASWCVSVDCELASSETLYRWSTMIIALLWSTIDLRIFCTLGICSTNIHRTVIETYFWFWPQSEFYLCLQKIMWITLAYPPFIRSNWTLIAHNFHWMVFKRIQMKSKALFALIFPVAIDCVLPPLRVN